MKIDNSVGTHVMDIDLIVTGTGWLFLFCGFLAFIKAFRIRATEMACYAWPRTQGKITHSEVDEVIGHRGGGGPGYSYIPNSRNIEIPHTYNTRVILIVCSTLSRYCLAS